jgi:hypothetical protein
MVLKRADNGKLYREPPYSDEELEEIYKSLGPPTIVASVRPRTAPTDQSPQSPPQPPAKPPVTVATTRPRGTLQASAPQALQQPPAKPRRRQRRRPTVDRP